MLVKSYIALTIYVHKNIFMHVMFVNGPGDWGSIPSRVIPKKKVLDASL